MTFIYLKTTAVSDSYPYTNSEAAAYVASMTVEPDSTRKGHIDTLIGSLKSAGVWANLDWLSLFAAHDSQAARINAVSPTDIASAINSPTFTTDRGYAGDGATSYLSSGITAGSRTKTDHTLFAYVDLSGASLLYCIGGRAASHYIREGGGVSPYAAAFTTTSENASAGTSANDTFHIVARNGTAQEYEAYGIGTSSSPSVTNSTAADAQLIKFGAVGLGGYSDARLSVVGFGSYLTETERDNFKTALDTYLTAVGAI